MKYTIDWLKKGKYGDEVSATDEKGGKIMNATLGKEFATDNVMAGHTIEATTWTSPKNDKVYLFKAKDESAPKNTPTRQFGASGAIKEAQATKREDIKQSMDRKEQSILMASTMRDATILTAEQIKRSEMPLTDEDIKEIWLKWRNWLIKQGDITETDAF